MVLFKSCPRCAGDRTLEHDLYGWYIICLACGYVTYPTVKNDLAHTSHERRKSA